MHAVVKRSYATTVRRSACNPGGLLNEYVEELAGSSLRCAILYTLYRLEAACLASRALQARAMQPRPPASSLPAHTKCTFPKTLRLRGNAPTPLKVLNRTLPHGSIDEMTSFATPNSKSPEEWRPRLPNGNNNAVARGPCSIYSTGHSTTPFANSLPQPECAWKGVRHDVHLSA